MSGRLVAVGIAALTMSPAVAAAHASPEILSVALYDDQAQPLLLRSTYGLIARTTFDAPWHFICPTQHGGPSAPPVIDAGSQRAWLVTVAGAQLVTATAAPLSEKFTEVISSKFPRLAVAFDGVLAMTREDPGTNLFRLTPDGAEPMLRTNTRWQDIVGMPDRYVLARTSSTSKTIFSETSMTTTSTFSVVAPGFDVRFHEADADTLYAVTVSETSAFLLRVVEGEARVVFESDRSIQGVTTTGGRTFVAIGNQIHELADDGDVAPTAESAFVTCLQNGAGGAFACVGTQLFALKDDGTLGDAWFRIDEVEAPETVGLSGPEKIICDIEWRDLASEAGIPLPTPVRKSEASSGGCDAVGARGVPSWGLWIFGLLFAISRSRIATLVTARRIRTRRRARP